MKNPTAGKSKAKASVPTIQIGVSRPELPLTDLPTPEEVFRKPKIGFKELIMYVLGPSMIALGAALGSGEWLLGPLAFGRFGFMGLGWLIALSAVICRTSFTMRPSSRTSPISSPVYCVNRQ